MDSNDVAPGDPPPPPLPPPVSPPPPVLMPPAPSRPVRKSRGWMIIAIILLLLLVVSAFFNFGHVFDRFVRLDGLQMHHVAGPRLEEALIEDNGGSSKIAVVPVEGVITGQIVDRGGFNMVDIIKAQLKRADEDDKVKAVLLKVDSPGGEVLASDEISNAIKDFQDDSRKPVIVSMGSLAASGGYYVSAPCRYIVANELTITGSIGVIMSTWNYRGLMTKGGIRPYTHKSGRFKDMLSGEREPNEIPAEEREMVQKFINETYEKFKDVVAKGRKQAHEDNGKDGKALAPNWAEFADGRILSGKEALELGLVDQVGNFEAAVKAAKKIGGIRGNVNLIENGQRGVLAVLLGIFGRSESRALKVDIGIEAPKIEAGRMYFL